MSMAAPQSIAQRGRGITRREAAALLRAARTTHDSNAAATDQAGWAYAIMSDHRMVCALYVDRLVEQGHFDLADAVLARHLMQLTNHPLMRMRYARSLFLQGRLEQAGREIARVLEARPSHRGALVLAGQIAAASQQHAVALKLAYRVLRLRPDDERALTLRIQALLGLDRVDDAAWHLAHHVSASTLLRLQVLRAQGRVLDAIDLLQHELPQASTAAQEETLLLELIDLLELRGDLRAITALVERVQAHQMRAKIRIAQALLMLGEMRGAERLACDVRETSALNRAARQILAVVFAVTNRPRQARAELDQLAAGKPGIDRASLAGDWMRGLCGQILAEQIDAKAAGADPHTSVLQPLLSDAIATLQHEIERGAASMDAQRRAALRQHIAVCCFGAGRPRDAARELQQADLEVAQASGREPHANSAAIEPVRRRRAA